MSIRYSQESKDLTLIDFLQLLKDSYPHKHFDSERLSAALLKTINISAWDEERLVGSVRILTDGYLFSTIPEIVVHPAYRSRGIGSALMKLATEIAPTGLFFGAKSGNERFFERLGFKKGIQSFQSGKPT